MCAKVAGSLQVGVGWRGDGVHKLSVIYLGVGFEQNIW